MTTNKTEQPLLNVRAVFLETKRCFECGEIKSTTEFSKCSARKDGLNRSCKNCCKHYSKEWRGKNPEKLEKYSANKNQEYGEAKQKSGQLYYEKVKITKIKKSWVYQIKNKYKLTEEQYSELLEKQNGVCAICGKAEKSKARLCVDHDHKTGVVRGLLCGNCNKGIGHLMDDIGVLKSAITYLENISRITSMEKKT